jgi:3-oxoacyl-[acyl-carrier-protein] synthase II
MAREVWITGYGLLSPLGETPAAWFDSLAAPERWRASLDAETYAPFPIHPIRDYALETQVPKPGDQRAMGPLMQYGAYAAGLALEMAGIKGNAELLQETHLVAASGAGERDWELDKQILAKLDAANDRGAFLNRQLSDGLRPTLFLAQLPNLFAGNISLIHGVAGSSRTFMGEEAAGVDALRVALRRCAAGQGDIFLVGGAFNAARPDIHQQYHAGGILMNGAWQPLWRRPEAGVCLGSSGAFLVIEARERAEKRGAKAHARLLAVESERTVRKPGAAAQVAEGEFARILPLVKPGTLAVLSGASGRGSITHEEREFLAAISGDTGLPVRGTAAALGHSMECAFLQNLALAAAVLGRGALFPPLDPAEPIEAEFDGRVHQVLVTSWGQLKGEGMALVEAIDGE